MLLNSLVTTTVKINGVENSREKVYPKNIPHTAIFKQTIYPNSVLLFIFLSNHIQIPINKPKFAPINSTARILPWTIFSNEQTPARSIPNTMPEPKSFPTAKRVIPKSTFCMPIRFRKFCCRPCDQDESKLIMFRLTNVKANPAQIPAMTLKISNGIFTIFHRCYLPMCFVLFNEVTPLSCLL